MRSEVVIIGGGITGLTIARLMKADACLFEKERAVGGCLRTDYIDGYAIDRTGHLLHFREKYVQDLMYKELGLKWLHFDRRAEIHMLDRRIPYPLQYNLYALPEAERQYCLQSYLELEPRQLSLESSFEEWSSASYGAGLHELFLGPYNRKLWQADLASISAEWAERFVPMPNRDLIVRGAQGPDLEGAFGYNATFSYPSTGGTGAIVDALTRGVSIPIHTDAALCSIDPVAKICEFSNGARVGYDTLVSTIPLPILIKSIEGVDKDILELAQGLRNNSVLYYVFGFRVSGEIPKQHWIYVPDERFSMYRAGILSNYSPDIAPKGSVLVCAEIGCEGGTAAGADADGMRDRALDDLRSIGLVQADWELEFEHKGAIDCAYVIYDEHRRKALPRIQAYLEGLGIHSVGRYGAWGYGSMGDAVIEGRDCAQRINESFGRATLLDS